jgi:hypothetical protein
MKMLKVKEGDGKFIRKDRVVLRIQINAALTKANGCIVNFRWKAKQWVLVVILILEFVA